MRRNIRIHKVLAKHKEAASPPGAREGWGKPQGTADTVARGEERGGVAKETGCGSALQAEDTRPAPPTPLSRWSPVTTCCKRAKADLSQGAATAYTDRSAGFFSSHSRAEAMCQEP